MPITNVQADWVDGNLVLRDKSGNEILTFDGTNRKLTLSTGTTLDGGIFAALAAIPTADPEVDGQIWNDGGTLKASAGAA